MAENCNNNYIEEDEIDLRELFSTIWQHKFTIAVIALLVTSAALLYALKKPNVYQTSTVLILKNNDRPKIGGGAAAMAAMAGIDLSGGSGGLDIASLFKDLLGDYAFHKEIIEKYKIYKMLSLENIEKNFVFAANKKEIYNFFKSTPKEETRDHEEIVFDTFKQLKGILSTSTDKESGAITLSAKFEDRFVAKGLVDIYLKEMSDFIRKLDFKELDEQTKYYERELYNSKNLDLKSNINDLLSALVKKKVLSKSGEFYMVKQLTKPKVPYIKDKAGPKRALIIIVAFITSIILGIFFVFFKEFLKGTDEHEKELEIESTY